MELAGLGIRGTLGPGVSERHLESAGLRGCRLPDDALKQRALNRKAQGSGDLDEGVDTRNARALLKKADLGPMKIRQPADLFLGKAGSLAGPMEIGRKAPGDF